MTRRRFSGIPGFTFEDKVDYRLAANLQQPSIARHLGLQIVLDQGTQSREVASTYTCERLKLIPHTRSQIGKGPQAQRARTMGGGNRRICASVCQELGKGDPESFRCSIEPAASIVGHVHVQ